MFKALFVILAASFLPWAAQAAFQHAEARLTHPIALTPDGSQLLAVDSINACLSVFDVSQPGSPVLTAQIPTGLEPVSVRVRTADEVWVVNELSDSITIISLSQKKVLATLSASDEPADVVFAQGKAFVTCARSNSVRIFSVSSRTEVTALALEGLYPRAMAVSADGSKVYAAFFESGNRTTILPKEKAPPQPAPTNPNLPAPPQTALIVPASDPRVSHVTLDHDVAEIDAVQNSIVSYASGVGTNLFSLEARPGSGDLWIGNTEAFNLIRYEPNLRGRFAANRITRIEAGSGDVTPFDLNPGIGYETLPNPSAQVTALAQPVGLAFTSDGSAVWIAAFGSDRIAKVDPENVAVLSRIDLRTGVDTSSAAMRGPRGLALHESSQRLFVLNKLSHTISVISTETQTISDEIPISPLNPMPGAIKAGRGYLYDARLSGNGTVSCGTCHFDADRDGLAWDLGDPGGEMMQVIGANLSVHDKTPRQRNMHPMKGPMTTQTLRGMQDGAPFHWRGDRRKISDFNPTFNLLMGGEQIEEQDMDNMTAYLLSIVNHPNPNRNPDRTLPKTFGEGDPNEGRVLYNSHNDSHCVTCHTHPKGSDNNIDLPQEVGSIQPIKTAPLRTVYQRLFYNPRVGAESLSGFGMLHDGTGFAIPIVHPYVLDNLGTLQQLRDVSSFLMCFDTGVAPIVGMSVGVEVNNRATADVATMLTLFENRASADPSDCDVIVRGRVGGITKQFQFVISSKVYQAEAQSEGTLTRAALLASLGGDDALTFLAVLPGQGARMSVDEDGDGFLNEDDPNPGLTDGPPMIIGQPQDTAVPPGASLTLTVEADGLGLTYEWYKGTQLLPSVVGNALSIPEATESDAGSYTVKVINAAGSQTSRVAIVEVYPAPSIASQPVSMDAKEGMTVILTVTATGRNLTYQWRRGMQNIGGATDRSLKLSEVSIADVGNYNVVVSNGAGSVVSNSVSLTVRLKPVVNELAFAPAMVGQAYTAGVTATNNPMRFTITGLPSGVTYDPATGAVQGRPKVAKTYQIKVTASNDVGTSAPVSQELVVLPFPVSLLGTFNGLIPRSPELNGNLGGRLKVTTSKTASYSGSLTLGSSTLSFKGALEAQPGQNPVHEQILRPRNKPELKIKIVLDLNNRQLSGFVEQEGHSLDIEGWLPHVDLAAYTGNYTLALGLAEGDKNQAHIPQGYSHGGFKVSTKGTASGVLYLADGSKVTLSSPVGGEGRLPFHTLLYSKTGSVQGRLTIGGVSNRSLGGSQVSWYKQTQTRFTRLYSQTFGPLDLQLIGGLYTIPESDKIALGLEAGAGNARLRFSGGGLPDPATRTDLESFEIQPGSPAKILLPSVNPGLIKLSVTPGKGTSFSAGKTGVFKGSFTLADLDTSFTPNKNLKRASTFSGALVDDGTSVKGYGFFILAQMPTADPPVKSSKSPQLSGQVILQAAP